MPNATEDSPRLNSHDLNGMTGALKIHNVENDFELYWYQIPSKFSIFENKIFFFK